MQDPRRALAQKYSIDGKLNKRKPIPSPTEDSLPPRITRKLVKYGYHYNGKRNAWMPNKNPGADIRLPGRGPQIT